MAGLRGDVGSGGVPLGTGAVVGGEDNRRIWYDHTGLIGQPECGKSYRTKLILQNRVRAIAVDSEFQFGYGKRQNPLPGFVVVNEPGELKEFLRPRLGAGFQVLYQPKFEPEVHLEYVMQLLCEVGDCTIGIDEAANYCKPNFLPKYFDYIIRCGRHVGISLVWNSQRPRDVSTRLRSMTQRLMMFRLQEDVDLDWVRGRGLSEEHIARLASLDNRLYFEKSRIGQWELHDGEGRVI